MKKELRKALKSKELKDVMAFFYQNQTALGTPEEIAPLLDVSVDEVAVALETLAQIGVLVKDCESAREIYCYTNDERAMKTIEGVMRDV